MYRQRLSRFSPMLFVGVACATMVFLACCAAMLLSAGGDGQTRAVARQRLPISRHSSGEGVRKTTATDRSIAPEIDRQIDGGINRVIDAEISRVIGGEINRVFAGEINRVIDPEVDPYLPAFDRGPRAGYLDMDDTALPDADYMEKLYWWQGWERFRQKLSLQSGLGPSFNGRSCAECHAHPSMGGSSPMENPYTRIARETGNGNQLPSFARGATVVARFIRRADGSPDGAVHNVFVITGGLDSGAAHNCTIEQPDFARAIRENNIAYRQVTPVFGAGLIENITEGEIIRNKDTDAPRKELLGISGRANRDERGRITRFGWKAQQSLETFTGDAMVTEMGQTNALFPHERTSNIACRAASELDDRPPGDGNDAWSLNDLQALIVFQRFLAPPAPAAPTPVTESGRLLFEKIGCALCHTPTLKTGSSSSLSLDNKAVNLYSDLLVHDMGETLADGITQGLASPREFRTAPLWGLGRRLWFLHDGRTDDLVTAIGLHASPGSEANTVVENFRKLPAKEQQALLDFLRSL
ncbi:MAG TPA: di-heme oxidoredictase family protein [Candidatus Obscuribacterales bacterium]